MSLSGISSSSLYDTQSVQSSAQQFRQEFQQLGQDLRAGNLSAAQSDFARFENLSAQNSAATSQSNSPGAQAFSQLAKDLQAGNLPAAQQDFATIPAGLSESVWARAGCPGTPSPTSRQRIE